MTPPRSDKGWLVFHRADGGWVLKVGPEWKPRRLPPTVKTRRQAEQEAARLVSAGTVHKPRTKAAGETVATVQARWVALRVARPDVRPGTLAANRSHLRAHIIPTLGDRPLDAITVPELRAWVREIRGKVSAHYCRNVHTTLVVLLDDAIGEGWLASPANPARAEAVRAELPAPRAAWGKKVPRLASLEEAQLLLSCPGIPIERATRYALVLTSGLRDGEIAGLRWRHVELGGDAPRVEIDRALAMHGDEGYATEGDLKTDHAERTLPLHPAAVAALTEYAAEYWIPVVGRRPNSEDFVFVGQRGRAKATGYRPKSAELLRHDLASAELPTTFAGSHTQTFHGLRRTVATHLAEAGVPADVRAQLLGHSARGAEGHYVAAMARQLREALSAIPLSWTTGLVRVLVRPMVRSRTKTDD